MKNLKVLITQEQIEERIRQVATLLDKDYEGKELVFVVILKGAICLAVDLMRKMQTSIQLEFIQASSYGQRGDQRGELSIQGLESLALEGKHTLIIDDIYDSGHTMTAIVKALQNKNPASLKSLVLLRKQTDRPHTYEPDYTLFPVEDYFVIGWGLDYKEHHRELMSICAFEKEELYRT